MATLWEVDHQLLLLLDRTKAMLVEIVCVVEK